MEKEPYGIDGPNLYHYVKNNPLYYHDSNGLEANPFPFADGPEAGSGPNPSYSPGYSPEGEADRGDTGKNKCPPKAPCSDPGFCSEGATATHPGAAECFRTFTPVKNYFTHTGGPGMQCCYDASGGLITSGPGAGTYDYTSPSTGRDANGKCKNDHLAPVINHIGLDVLPWFLGWD